MKAVRHWKRAVQLGSSGISLMPASSSSPPNLSSPREAKRPDNASCSTDRTCTFQWPEWANAGRLYADLARLHSTSGGSRDTELKLLAVIPIGEPSSARVVMMVTPVVKVLNASRNALGLKFAGAVITASYHPDSVVAV